MQDAKKRAKAANKARAARVAAGRGAGPTADDLPSVLDNTWKFSPEDQVR